MDYIINIQAKFNSDLTNLQSQYKTIKSSMEEYCQKNPIKLAVDFGTGDLSLKNLQELFKNEKLTLGINETGLDSVKNTVVETIQQTENLSQSVQQAQQSFNTLGNAVKENFNLSKYISLLKDLGIDDDSIQKATKEIESLHLKITKLSGTTENIVGKEGTEQVNKVLINAVDQYGKLVSLTQVFTNNEDKNNRTVVTITDNIKQQEQAQAKANKELEKSRSIYSDLKSKFDALYATQSGGKGKINGVSLIGGQMQLDNAEQATKSLEHYKDGYNAAKKALDDFDLAIKSNNPNMQSYIDTVKSAIEMLKAFGKVALQDQSGSLAFDAKNLEELKNTATSQLNTFEDQVKSSGLATTDLNNKIAQLKSELQDVKISTDFTKFTDKFRTAKADFDALKQSASSATNEISNSSKLSQLKNDWADIFKIIKEFGIEYENLARGKNAGELMSNFKAMKSYMSKDSLNTEELKRAKAIYDSIKSSIDQVVEAKKKSSKTEAFNFDKDRALQNLSEIKKQIQELGTDEGQLTHKTEDLENAFANITDKNSLGTFNKMLSQATKEIQEQVRSANELANSQAKQTRLGVDFTNASKNFDDLQRKIRDLNIDENTLTYTTADLVAAYDKISDNTSLGTFNAMLRQATQEVANQEREINKSNKSLQDQEKEWQKLIDLINKAYGEATNSNTNSKAIQDPATIKLLRDQYDAVVVAVNEVRNATTDTFDQSKKAAEQAIQAFIEYSKVLQNSEQSIQATDNAIKKLQTDTSKGLFAQNSGNSEVVQLQQDIKALSDQYAQLQSRFQNEGATQEVIAGFTQLDNQIKSTSERAKELQSSLKSAKDAAALEDRKSNLNNKIETWLRNNTRASESMRQSMKSLQTQIQSADKQTLTHLTQQFNELNRTAQQTGQIGKSALDIFKEKAAKFAGWFGLANAFMMITNEAKQALVTLKDVDTILTEISKTSERSAESLEKLGETAFDAASKYGVSVQNYLTGVQEMARAGYETLGEGQSEKMAELALLVQAAGDVSDSTARDYLIATDAAYQLGGSIEKLQTILDGQNKVNIKCPHIQKCMCA